MWIAPVSNQIGMIDRYTDTAPRRPREHKDVGTQGLSEDNKVVLATLRHRKTAVADDEIRQQ